MPSRKFVKKVRIANPLTIKGKLLLSALSELLLIIIFTLFLIGSTRQTSTVTSAESKATDIVKTVTEIRFVTFENLLHHDSRSYSQWQTGHNELANQLSSFPVTNGSEERLIANIRAQHEVIGPIFSKLVASYGDVPTSQNLVAHNQYQERLASQLVSKQQVEISTAFKLADLKRDEALKIRQQTSSFAVIVILLMFVITGSNFVFVYAAISRALTALQQGARQIAKGALDYRIRYKRKGDEFSLLAATFNDMATSLEQVDRVKSEFVLLVSHQLRTPATAVKGFLAQLTAIYGKDMPAEQQEMVVSAYEENERQIRLINRILAVAQVEAGEVALYKQPTDLVDLAKNVAVLLRLFLDDKQQKVTFDYPKNFPLVNIDADRIRIVLENLLRNAGKFAPPGSVIEVILRQNKKHIEITIKDYGPGISDEDRHRLFKKFSRGSSEATAKTEGSGLGLYLAKRIVELHQGTISVHSVVGKSTSFTVQLPK